MVTLRIADPALVLLVGAAGSGKSTLAARWFATEEVLSSDAFRALVSGDAADQRATGPAFAILQRMLDGRLAAGLTTVVDATNVTARARAPLRESARRVGVPACAIVLDLPAAVVHARNAARAERVVDRDVIDRHLAAVRALVDGRRLVTEGFAPLVVLRTPAEVDALVVERETDGAS